MKKQKENSKRILVKEELGNKFERIAKIEGRTVDDLVNDILKEYLKSHKA